MIWRQLRWRLTFWNTLLMAVVVATFAAAVYATMSSTTWSQVAATANDAAKEALTTWRSNDRLDAGSNRSVVAIRIADSAGRTLALRGELSAIEAVPNPADALIQTQLSDRMTVATRTVESDGLRVTVALDVTREQERLEDLGRVLVLATVAATFLSGVAGLIMAQLALRPIDRMSAAVRRIALDPGTGHLDRLPLQPPEDELYRLGETFNAMLDRIEHSFERQTRFVAHASHELRTPLTVIQSYASMLTRWGRHDPSVLEEALAAVNRETERMSRLLEDLLLLARADAGLTLDRAPVNMATVLQALGRDLSISAASLGGRRTESPGAVTIDVSTPEPAWVDGDAHYLRQLILVLAENAIQYTPSGGRITLSLAQQEDQVLVHVIDTGIGIPPEHQSQIFDRFNRVDKDRARATGGSGLGLSIAAWLARVHGGSIACRSRPGQGSTFTIRLPRLIAQ